MTHASLFSGIGGFDLAAEWMGWDNLFNCEKDSFCRRVLDYYWPKIVKYEDITKTDFTIWRGRVDVLTGGFPCQPFSTAGKRQGKADDRYLWPEMLRAIREIEPRYIVGENVPGLLSLQGGLVFEEVCVAMENEGYEVQPINIPACATGAPHRRERIWFVAHATGSRFGNRKGFKIEERREPEPIITGKLQGGLKGFCKEWDVANTTKSGFEDLQRGRQDRVCGLINAANTGCSERKDGLYGKEQERETRKFGDCDKEQNRWDRWPTQSPICSRDDGFSGGLDGITFSKWRNESIKAYGNAVVPQVVMEIFKLINQFENVTI